MPIIKTGGALTGRQIMRVESVRGENGGCYLRLYFFNRPGDGKHARYIDVEHDSIFDEDGMHLVLDDVPLAK